MNWKDIIYLVSFIIAIIAFWLKIRDLNLKLEARTAPYRQTLYMKQLEGYSELIETMIKIEYEINKFKTKYSESLIKSKQERSQEFLKNKNEFKDKLSKWVIFLPEEIGKIYYEFYRNINVNIDKIDLKIIYEIRSKLYRIAYETFGIEPISEELKKLIEKSS